MNELPEEDKTQIQQQEESAQEQITEEVFEENPSEDVTGSEDAAPDLVTEIEKTEEVPDGGNTPLEQAEPAKESTQPEKEASSKKKTAKSKKRKKKTAKDFAIEFFIKVGITALAVALLLIFVVGIHVNHGNSAYPMIKDGDLVITYKLDKGQNGVEIAYKINGEVKFGRIVAKEGDVVNITDSGLLVNDYGILEDVVYPTTSEGATISFPYIVPQGTVFVLNDYRADAGDSRTYGAIPLSDVEGEVVLILRRRGI